MRRVLGLGGNDALGIGRRGVMHALRAAADSQGKNIQELDIKQEVGSTAGKVYKLLEGKGETPLGELRSQMADSGPLFMAALGWLLREDKIDVKIASDGLTVKLK